MMSAFGFYPEDRGMLEVEVEKLLKPSGSFRAKGIIVPHAGYEFSGDVAGNVFASARTDKRSFVIFGPNHTGRGSDIALSSEPWKTPIGNVNVNKKLVKELSKHIDIDESSHNREHSIEVQLPFLQVLYRNFEFAPISLKHAGFDDIEKISRLFTSENFYIASSDFIHFGENYNYAPVHGNIEENLKWVEQTDKKLIELICNMDAEKFYETVISKDYSICGVYPITLLLLVMKRLGAKHGTLVKYKTSYEVNPSSSFVSYAGIIFE